MNHKIKPLRRNNYPFLTCKGPSAANGHTAQNPPCQSASYALRHPKQRKVKFDWMKSLCFGCPSVWLALQHGGFLYHVTVAVKGSLVLICTCNVQPFKN